MEVTRKDCKARRSMDNELFERLKADPENAKSSLQLNAERNAQEHARTLRDIKRPVTAEQRAAAKQKFDAINAANQVLDAVEATGIVETRKAEIKGMIIESLKDTTTAEEAEEVCRRAVPLLTRFVTTMSDFQVSQWVNHQVESLRAEKAARQLAGL